MENTHEQAVREVVQTDLQGRVVEMNELTGGYYGHVYKVKVETAAGLKEVVVKFVASQKEDSFADEDNDNRVYGSRWSNLKPSLDLLKANGLPVPQLFSTGELKDFKQHYAILEFMDGEPTKDIVLARNAPDIEDLHALQGDTLGRMHAITRDFQGWVAMQQPYAKDWKSAFFESIASHLDRAAKHNAFITENRTSIQQFVSRKKEIWVDPQKFVFSHTDGFQGMVKFENGEWRLQGVIDVEDNQYTDQRFALAGHELSVEFSKRTVRPEFWEKYQLHTQVDSSFPEFKNLFKLYYLMCWTSVANEAWRGNAEEKPKAIVRLEQLITEAIR